MSESDGNTEYLARQALSLIAAGRREVTTHQAMISHAGFVGSGYIIIDPQTGAGAYKISGGANGSLTRLVDQVMSYLAGFLSLVSGKAGAILETINIFRTVIDLLTNCPSPLGAWLAGLAVAFFIVGIMLPILIGIVITGGLGLVMGILAAFLFGAIIQAWLDAARNYRCTSRRRRLQGALPVA